MYVGRSGGPLGNAYIIPLDPQIDSYGNSYIPIYYHFPIGNGDSISEISALVRPFRKLMHEGKPAGKTAFVFYLENGNPFVYGSFTFTGRRTVFFPPATLTRVEYSSDTREPTESGLTIDHLTLEENFVNWHLTFSQDHIRYPTKKTRKVGQDVFLWFVIAIPDPTQLEPMPKTQQYLLKAPHMTDLERRKKIMLDSVKDNIFPVTVK